jgi:hypothetical protein
MNKLDFMIEYLYLLAIELYIYIDSCFILL